MSKKIIFLLIASITVIALIATACGTDQETSGTVKEEGTGQTITTGAEETTTDEKVNGEATGILDPEVPKYGGDLTITTSVAESVKIDNSIRDAIRIDISDTGVGIPKENLDKLFTPFFTTKEKGKGVGLGLSVVHGIIERHQGKITIESNPVDGTTFSIFLGIINENKD